MGVAERKGIKVGGDDVGVVLQINQDFQGYSGLALVRESRVA